ncbi:hypothetical protein [Cellulomonas soli]
MKPLSVATLGKAAGAFVLGLLVGTLGTVMHRWSWPWGVILCLALVLVAGVTARAWGGGVPVIGYAGGLFLAVQVLAQRGPGGDVLVPAGDTYGWVWIGGAALAVATVALVPRRAFDDTPPPRGARAGSVPAGSEHPHP